MFLSSAASNPSALRAAQEMGSRRARGRSEQEVTGQMRRASPPELIVRLVCHDVDASRQSLPQASMMVPVFKA